MKRGRKPRADVAGQPVTIRLTPYERARIGEAAKVERKPFADYCRDVLLSESEDLLEEESHA